MIGMVFSIIALLVLSIGAWFLGYGIGLIFEEFKDHFGDCSGDFIGFTLWIAFSFVSILCKVKWCGFWYSVLYGVLAELAAALIWYIILSVFAERDKKQKDKEEREREERRREEELRQQREREQRDAEERQRRQREADQRSASGKLSDMAKDI